MGYRELLAVPEAMLPDARRRRALRAILADQLILEPEVAAKVRSLPRPWHLLRLDPLATPCPSGQARGLTRSSRFSGRVT